MQPGEAFGGGTLGRDVNYLCQIGNINNIKLELIRSILRSNEEHKLWALNIMKSNPNLPFLNVLILGATYKEGTDTLRKSNSFNLTKLLNKMVTKCLLVDNLSREKPCISLVDLKK